MANDITGSDVRCPKCGMIMYPEVYKNKYYLICFCGNGKEDLMKAIEKEEKRLYKLISIKKCIISRIIPILCIVGFLFLVSKHYIVSSGIYLIVSFFGIVHAIIEKKIKKIIWIFLLFCKIYSKIGML